MIKIRKHHDPNLTVISATQVILKSLLASRSMTFEELKATLKKVNPDLIPLYIPALNLLFLLGKVDYRKKTDSIEYVGP